MLEIAEQDILDSLKQDNPWWNVRFLGLPEELPKSRAYWAGFRKLALNWQVRRSVVLMGPRRVGKTVMLLELVRWAAENEIHPQCIMFAPLDTPAYSGMPLERFLKLFEKQTDHDPYGRRIVIFDEIQYLKDWEVHLKVLTDRYPNTRFIASGSSAAALQRKSHESGAGRFTDFLLPPLNFAEFLDFLDLEKELISERDADQSIIYNAKDIQRLNDEFVRYVNFGGYPEAVLNREVQRGVGRFIRGDIVDKVLLKDLPILYGIQDVQELNRLFMTIAYHSGQEISLDGLSQSSGASKNTIARYLEYLEAAFLILRVRRIDNAGYAFKRNRNFKAYLTNPSMRSALFAEIRSDDDIMGAMAETAIFSQWFHSDFIRNIYYARWKRQREFREVDIVSVSPATGRPELAIEIRWSDRYVDRPQDLQGLIEFAKTNAADAFPVSATTRTVSGQSTVDGITINYSPCALACYRIGREVISAMETG